MKPNSANKIEISRLDLYKKINPEQYMELEPTLLKITNSLENGILTKEISNYFDNSFNEVSFYLSLLREDYVHKFGFFLINENFLEVSKEMLLDHKILEVGAGSGFLSFNLQKNNIDITPIDLKVTKNSYGFHKKYTDIIETNAVDYLKKEGINYDTVIMSWPNYNTSFGHDVLKNMKKNQTLIYIGESCGGCTADDKFFELLDKKANLNQELTDKFSESSISWPGIHDRIHVFEIIK